MKIKSLMYVLLGTFTIVACTNSDNEEVVNNGGGGDNSPEYVIPAGFDFATSRSVTVAVASSKPVVVSLYPDEDCKEESYLVSDLLVKG